MAIMRHDGDPASCGLITMEMESGHQKPVLGWWTSWNPKWQGKRKHVGEEGKENPLQAMTRSQAGQVPSLNTSWPWRLGATVLLGFWWPFSQMLSAAMEIEWILKPMQLFNHQLLVTHRMRRRRRRKRMFAFDL